MSQHYKSTPPMDFAKPLMVRKNETADSFLLIRKLSTMQKPILMLYIATIVTHGSIRHAGTKSVNAICVLLYYQKHNITMPLN